MSFEWRQYHLGELTDWSSGGTPSKQEPKYWGGDLPWISASSMKGSRYKDSGLKITESGLRSGSRLAPLNAILLLVRGSILHQRVPIGITTRPVAFNQDVKAITIKETALSDDLIDPWFLLYWFKAKERELLSIVSFTGIGAGKFDTKQLQNLTLKVPPPKQREKIVSIAKAIDDKIELNQRMNETLEAMAQAIFKCWFVDFEPTRAKMAQKEGSGESEASICNRLNITPEILALFPNRLTESSLGPIPTGWKVERTEKLSQKIAMGPFGSNIKVSTFVEEGVPVISGHHLKSTLAWDEKHKFITEEHADRLKNSCVQSGDIVFTHAGSIGQVSLIPEQTSFDRYVISQRQFYLRPDKEKATSSFLVYFFKSRIGQHELLANTSQVGVPSIARPSSHLKSIELVSPGLDLMKVYDETCAIIFRGLVNNSKQSKTLSKTRDALLPKLLSGEISVGDTEDIAGTV